MFSMSQYQWETVKSHFHICIIKSENHTLSSVSSPSHIFKADFVLEMKYAEGEYVMFSYAIDSTSLPTQASQGRH